MASDTVGTTERSGGWMETDAPASAKGYRGVAMEGFIARWYARTRGSPAQLAAWHAEASELVRTLPAGAEVLEVAPGPGYRAVAIARAGPVHVTTLDISRTFVEMVATHARSAGVAVRTCLGDASRMPFADGSFDLVLCEAAFKNFSRPQASINEMHRVLRLGGVARVHDMRRDATDAAIAAEVRSMGLGATRAWLTTHALRGLRRRAYLPSELDDLAEASPFGHGEITTDRLGVELRLEKRTASPERFCASVDSAPAPAPRGGRRVPSEEPWLAAAGLPRRALGPGVFV